MVKNILITRPKMDSDILSKELRSIGFIPTQSPVIEVNYLNPDLPKLNDFSYVIFSSKNGIRAYAQKFPDRNLGIFVVASSCQPVEGGERNEMLVTMPENWGVYNGGHTSKQILEHRKKDDGTFIDDFDAHVSLGCIEPQYSGTFSVQDGYYEMLYELGGNQDLSESDIYISYPDDNTINYDYGDVLWTYKLDLNL